MNMEQWITWLIAFIQTTVQWLIITELLGVPILWIIGAFFVTGVMIRAFLIKP